jgi:predicted membrane protein
MKRKTFFAGLSLFVFCIFSLNFIANKLYWYSSIWWFDILMHFLGGFWLGLFFIWYLYKDLDKKELSKDNLIKLILGVLFVGFGWEIYEIIVNDLWAKNTFDLFDTSSDMVFDITGGLLAYYIFKNISKKD